MRGSKVAVIESGPAWTQSPGYLQNTGIGRFLYGNQGLGSGDWEVGVIISLQDLNGSAASLMVGGVNHLILDGGNNQLLLEGAIWGSQGVIGDNRSHITPGHPFEIILRRTGNVLVVQINAQIVAQRVVTTNAFGIVGLRPHRGVMRVYDFWAQGTLTGFLPVPALPRLLSMPTLDLAGRFDLHTVISPGSETLYNGHPTTLRLPGSETIFAVWTLGHGGTIYFLKRSDDGGRTWSENLQVPDNWARTYNCPTLHYLRAPDGRDRIFVFGGARAMFQSYSEDRGNTWTPMKSNGLTCVVAPMSVLPMKDGRHRMWYHRGFNDADTSPLTLWQAESLDGGLTWVNQQKILEITGADLAEPTVIRSPDGSRLLMLIRENQRFLNSLYMLSSDEGRSWSKPMELPGDLTGDRHVARYAADGRLLIAFRDVSATNTSSYGNLTLWVGEFDDVVGGTSGQYRVKLLHNTGGGIDSGYPGLDVLTDGTVLATTYVRYRSNINKPSIVCTRVDLAETDAALGIGEEQSGPPILLSQPLPREFPAGASATLRCTAAGRIPFTYQWYKDNEPIDGATDRNFVINSIQPTQAGNYHVVVSNIEGSASSIHALIQVWLPPLGILSVNRRSAFLGESFLFTATATGTPPFRYLWQKDGQILAVTNSPSFSINGAAHVNAGEYTVRIENNGSATTTNPVVVAVFGGEQLLLSASTGDRLLFSGERLAPNRSYRVQVSSDLQTWETTSRTISTDDHGKFASEVSLTSPRRFWRLVLE